jgi:hypothetical protein
MAFSLFRVLKGLEIIDRGGTDTRIELVLSNGSPDTVVTAPRGSIASDTTNGALYINTDGATAWQQLTTGGGSSAEEGFIRTFVGKTAAGAETPTYSSINVVVNGTSLETAIGALDAEIGPDVTPQTRTLQQLLVADAIKTMIDKLDAAIGADADMTSTEYIALASTIFANLSALDAQVKINADAITMGQSWRETALVLTESNTTNDWSNVANATALSTLLPFDDDDGAGIVLGDFSDGDFVLYRDTAGVDRIYAIYDDAGTLRVTQDAGVVDALATGDTFIVRNDLADNAGQENSSIYTYNGTDLVKIGDVDWSVATGINLSTGYAVAGAAAAVAAGDTVEVAISKIHKDLDDFITIFGTTRGDVNLGTFLGNIIADNESVKGALQDLEDAIEGGGLANEALGVGGTEVDVDTLLVDNYDAIEWAVLAIGVTDPTEKYVSAVRATHDGTPSADATVTDWSESGVVTTDNAFANQIDVNVDLNGAAGAQVIRLRISTTVAGGINFYARRRYAF